MCGIGAVSELKLTSKLNFHQNVSGELPHVPPSYLGLVCYLVAIFVFSTLQHPVFMAGILCGLYIMVCRGTRCTVFVGESDDASSTILYGIRNPAGTATVERRTLSLLHGGLNRGYDGLS